MSTISKNGAWRKPFFTIWGGQAISLVGSRLVSFALIWWLTQETGSARVLTVATLVSLVPQVLLGPFIGTLVDRWSRRWIMFSADLLVTLASAALAVTFYLGWQTVPLIMLVLFIRALGESFHSPAMVASTSLMVPEKHFTRVQGINQALQGGLNIISAPLGALLLVWISIQGILWIDVITAAAALIPLLFIAVPQPPVSAEAALEKPSMWGETKAGLRFVLKYRGLLGIMLMASLINFMLMPSVSLLPLLVTDHYGGGAAQFAALEATIGVGILLGGILMGVWGGFKRRIYNVVFGIALIGFGVAGLGLLPGNAFYLGVASFFLAGLAMPIANGSIGAIAQAVVPPDFQGRVFTLMGTLAMAMSPLALLLAGPLADVLGVRIWYIVGGVATMLLAAVTLGLPVIMQIEETSFELQDGEWVPGAAVPEKKPLV